jgi:hypothetical protein
MGACSDGRNNHPEIQKRIGDSLATAFRSRLLPEGHRQAQRRSIRLAHQDLLDGIADSPPKDSLAAAI